MRRKSRLVTKRVKLSYESTCGCVCVRLFFFFFFFLRERVEFSHTLDLKVSGEFNSVADIQCPITSPLRLSSLG